MERKNQVFEESWFDTEGNLIAPNNTYVRIIKEYAFSLRADFSRRLLRGIKVQIDDGNISPGFREGRRCTYQMEQPRRRL